jgi:hypothetical protein
VCRHYACQAPVDAVDALLAQLGGAHPPGPRH